MNKFESWLTRTQEVAVNQFGYEPEEADEFDLIDFGLMYDADLTPYEAVEEYRISTFGEEVEKHGMFKSYLEDTK